MSVLIVEHKPAERAALARLCESHEQLGKPVTAETGAEALTVIRAIEPEVLLLECELTDMSGFDLLRALPEHERPAAIMVASDNRYAAEVAEFAATEYLTLPVSEDRFHTTIQRLGADRYNGSPGQARSNDPPTNGRLAGCELREPAVELKDRLVGERGGRYYFFDPYNIDYIEADSNYIKIHAGNDQYIQRDSLARLVPLLKHYGFLRINRSVLINLRRVEYAVREGGGTLAFVLPSGDRLVSSAGYRLGPTAQLRVSRSRVPRCR